MGASAMRASGSAEQDVAKQKEDVERKKESKEKKTSFPPIQKIYISIDNKFKPSCI